jgi:hypothetical protein
VAERELTEPVALIGADGRLNPSAVGWARRPLVDTSGIDGRRAWGRNKRWEYWNVATPTHVVALTVSSIDYAAVNEVWVFDRRTQQTWGRAPTVLPSRGVKLPASLGEGPASAVAPQLAIQIVPTPAGTRLLADIPSVSIDVTVRRPEHHECLAVVVPWSPTRFQYTVKDVALPAAGQLVIDNTTYPVPSGESWAVLDHGRGRWPYDITWNWGAASGLVDGRPFGLQVGGKWTDGTGSTENGIVIGTVLHKISEELEWSYDLADWRRPWRIRGGELDAQFSPEYNRVARTNLGVIAASTDQCFGSWSGRFGEVHFADIFGWAEHVHNRWCRGLAQLQVDLDLGGKLFQVSANSRGVCVRRDAGEHGGLEKHATGHRGLGGLAGEVFDVEPVAAQSARDLFDDAGSIIADHRQAQLRPLVGGVGHAGMGGDLEQSVQGVERGSESVQSRCRHRHLYDAGEGAVEFGQLAALPVAAVSGHGFGQRGHKASAIIANDGQDEHGHGWSLSRLRPRGRVDRSSFAEYAH